MDIRITIFCKLCDKLAKRLGAGLEMPDGVEYVTGLRYGGSADNYLHVAYPKGADSPLPTIINFHGGGYVYGSPEKYRFYCAFLAQQGFTVINFNYRLAPKHAFPSPLEDMNAVMEWAVRNKDEYHIDLSNVFIVGDSAGAQLASQYAVICSNPEYSDIMGVRPPEFTLRAVGLNCGIYDLVTLYKVFPALSCYFSKEPEKLGEMLYPTNYIDSRYPPAFVLSAPGDFLLKCCEPMAELINEQGGTAKCRIYGTKESKHVFHLALNDEHAKKANGDEIEFFKEFIR